MSQRIIARPLAILPLVAALALLLVLSPAAQAQLVGGATQQVGGVWIDSDGVLRKRQPDETAKVREAWQKAMGAVPGELKGLGLRKVSLRRLEEALAEHGRKGTPLTDEMRFLAGLQRVQYVFVYPDQHDIVLAGPGEGWKLDAQGEVVGISTGRPVMLLDDLLVALRTAQGARQTAISCSIDPTAAGLVQLKSLVDQLHTIGDPSQTSHAIEHALGPQMISVTGVPADSHFARVIVAADYKMKRMAMNFEPAPVKGLPSFLHMMKATGKGMQNMMPRWWLEPNYEALLVSPDGLAIEFRGASVKAVTEEDLLLANGSRQPTGKANPVAKKWADGMTARYDELAVKDPVFGQLRNCIDLAVVSALIVKDHLTEKAGYSMSVLMHDDELPAAHFNSPKQVETQASVLQKGSNWIISASGGVQISSWHLATKSETSDSMAPARDKAAPVGDRWWWN